MPRFSSEEIEGQIEAKLTRQARLGQHDPPACIGVLDEAALHRMVGGPAVMSAQLWPLIEVSNLPNVTFQVIPFTPGGTPSDG